MLISATACISSLSQLLSLTSPLVSKALTCTHKVPQLNACVDMLTHEHVNIYWHTLVSAYVYTVRYSYAWTFTSSRLNTYQTHGHTPLIRSPVFCYCGLWPSHSVYLYRKMHLHFFSRRLFAVSWTEWLPYNRNLILTVWVQHLVSSRFGVYLG